MIVKMDLCEIGLVFLARLKVLCKIPYGRALTVDQAMAQSSTCLQVYDVVGGLPLDQGNEVRSDDLHNFLVLVSVSMPIIDGSNAAFLVVRHPIQCLGSELERRDFG